MVEEVERILPDRFASCVCGHTRSGGVCVLPGLSGMQEEIKMLARYRPVLAMYICKEDKCEYVFPGLPDSLSGKTAKHMPAADCARRIKRRTVRREYRGRELRLTAGGQSDRDIETTFAEKAAV